MISIVISEKGGGERREVYDQDEITVGRVKGNDVLLPKGNVSKRHARLILRDGRYIVTDLKSTNGTYVNHRRITHAALVREGDRIYIGDFILRIENGLRDADTTGLGSSSPSPLGAGQGSRTTEADAGSSGADSATSATGSNASAALQISATIPPGTPANFAPPEEIVSHFPIENDPDDSSPLLDLPGPPRVPNDLHPSNGRSPDAVGRVQVSQAEPTAAARIGAPTSSTGQFPAASDTPDPSDPVSPARSSQPTLDGEKRSAQRDALAALVDKVESEIGSTTLDTLPRPTDEVVERVALAIDRHCARLSAPADVDMAELREAARRELVDLGPLEGLLADEQLTRIRATPRELSLERRGQPTRYDGWPFATAKGVLRSIQRLCADVGQPLGDGELTVTRALNGGRVLSALLPPATLDGAVFQICRVRRETVTLNSLVRSGTVSRGMATLLSHCMLARANILVTGAPGHGVAEIASALALAAAKGTLLYVIGGDDDFGGKAVRVAVNGDDPEHAELVRGAARMSPDHLLAKPLCGEPLAALLDAVAEGQNGVVLANAASTLRQAVDRLAADLAGTREIGVSAAREWLTSAFDLGIEVSRLRDGRLRVVRISELARTSQAGHRDVFTFAYHRTASGGAIEGSFLASGTIPRIVEDMAARGMPLDTAIFRRHPSS